MAHITMIRKYSVTVKEHEAVHKCSFLSIRQISLVWLSESYFPFTFIQILQTNVKFGIFDATAIQHLFLQLKCFYSDSQKINQNLDTG